MLKIDMWYGDKLSDIDKYDVFWSDCDLVYRGNFYKDGKVIGDYSCNYISDLYDKLHNLAVE